jgi:hypothetical protein
MYLAGGLSPAPKAKLPLMRAVLNPEESPWHPNRPIIIW